jgi:hypothetical protein
MIEFDIRMLEPRHRLRFDAETRHLARSSVPAGKHHLEGHSTFQCKVTRLVEHAHAATAEDALDLVAWHRNRRRGRARLRALGLGSHARHVGAGGPIGYRRSGRVVLGIVPVRRRGARLVSDGADGIVGIPLWH